MTCLPYMFFFLLLLRGGGVFVYTIHVFYRVFLFMEQRMGMAKAGKRKAGNYFQLTPPIFAGASTATIATTIV